MSELFIVAPFRPDARERVRAHEGLEGVQFERGRAYVTDHEAIFLFEGPGPPAVRRRGEDPSVWRVAEAREECLAGRPRVARTAFSWARP